jgi:hypothetical protein
MIQVNLIPFKEPSSLAGPAAKLPALFVPDEKAAERFVDFFTANIRNENTRRAYYKAAYKVIGLVRRHGPF